MASKKTKAKNSETVQIQWLQPGRRARNGDTTFCPKCEKSTSKNAFTVCSACGWDEDEVTARFVVIAVDPMGSAQFDNFDEALAAAHSFSSSRSILILDRSLCEITIRTRRADGEWIATDLLKETENALKNKQYERDQLYWRFTRMAKAPPVPATVARAVDALEKQVKELRQIAESNSADHLISGSRYLFVIGEKTFNA